MILLLLLLGWKKIWKFEEKNRQKIIRVLLHISLKLILTNEWTIPTVTLRRKRNQQSYDNITNGIQYFF